MLKYGRLAGGTIYSMGLIPATAPCPRCTAPITFGVADTPSIMQLNKVAIIVIEHCGPLKCKNCSQIMLPVCGGLPGGAEFHLQPIQVKEAPLVVPASGPLPKM